MSTVLAQLATHFNAFRTCAEKGNNEWKTKHKRTIEDICCYKLPHGSGYDMGVTLDMDASTDDALVFLAPFHHMDDNGYYCGWIEYKVVVTPSFFDGFSIDVHVGANSTDGEDVCTEHMCDFVADCMRHALSQDM